MESMVIEKISGGSRQDLAMSEMPPDTWLSLINVEYDTDGNLISRGGQAAFNATAITASTMDGGIRFYRVADATKKHIVSAQGAGNAKIYQGDDAGGTFTEITAGTALTTGLPVEFCNFKDYILMTNGTQTVQHYTTGATKADCVYSNNNRKGKYIAAKSNMVFLAGDPSAKNTIYFSGEGFWTVGPTTDCSFPTANTLAIPGQTNDYITGMAVHSDRLFVFRTRDVWEITGEESVYSIDFHEFINNAGAVGQRAIFSTPYGLGFVGEKTVWFVSTGGALVDVGKAVRDTLDAAVLTSAVAAYYPKKQQAYISFKATSASTVNDAGLIIDFKNYERGEIRVTEHTVGASAFISAGGAADNSTFFRLCPATSGATQGVMYQMDTGTQDASANFTCTMKTKHFNMGDPNTLKLFRGLALGMNANTETTPLSLTVYTDRGNREYPLGAYTAKGFLHWGDFIYGQARYGGGLYQTAFKRAPAGLQGREIQLGMTKTDANAITLFQYTLMFDKRASRWG